jgi:hypothetical protein
MLYALLIATVYQFVHHGITAVANGKAKMMHTIAMFLDKLVVSARIII